MYKKGMRRAAALLAVCWLGLLFRAAAETPAEKLERLRAEQQAIEQQIEQNRTDAARAGDLVNLYTAKEHSLPARRPRWQPNCWRWTEAPKALRRA